jgi:nucleoside-diphosphate-sugar epimerase
MIDRQPRFVVTGSAGYIGSEVFLRLCDISPGRVVGIDRRPSMTTTILWTLGAGVPPGLGNPEVIYHLAGLFEKDFERRPLIPWLAYYGDNVDATRRVLEFAESTGSHLVFSSTLLVSETPRPQDSYTATKGQAEALLVGRCSVSAAVCRLPRVIGLGHQPQASPTVPGKGSPELPEDIVSHFVTQAVFNQRIEYSGGQLRRWYIHLDEAVKCLETCSHLRGVFDARLYGPITIAQVARLVARAAEHLGMQVALKPLPGGTPDAEVSMAPGALRNIVHTRFSCSEELIQCVAQQYLYLLCSSRHDTTRATISSA